MQELGRQILLTKAALPVKFYSLHPIDRRQNDCATLGFPIHQKSQAGFMQIINQNRFDESMNVCYISRR
jgi:hypothetical protein